MAMFAAGAWFIATTVPHVHERVEIWLDPYVDPANSGYQILQSIFAQADGGLFGKGFGQALIAIPNPSTDVDEDALALADRVLDSIADLTPDEVAGAAAAGA
jgi:hypothetical protein